MAKSLLQTIQNAVAPAKGATLVGTARIVSILPGNRYVVNFKGFQLVSDSATDEPMAVAKKIHVIQSTTQQKTKILALGSAG